MSRRSSRSSSDGVLGARGVRALRCVGAALLVVASLAGCSQRALYSKVDEREANEQVSVLRMAGIGADKVARDTAFDVTVPDRDFARAQKLLTDNGLPRRKYDTLCALFKREGFVTSTAQEHVLRMCGRAQEITRSLSLFTEVLDANVVLDEPEKAPLMDKAPLPKASVVVRLRHGVDIDEVKSRIRKSVLASVHGLTHDNIAIEHSVGEPPSATTPATADTRPVVIFGMPWPLALSFALGAGLLAAALLAAWRHRRMSFASTKPRSGGALAPTTRDALRSADRGAVG